MTGDIFRGVVQNALFNFVSQMTGQGIHLLGMLTEAIHTPFMQDRHLALENAKYVMGNMAGLGAEVTFREDGQVVRRAHAVLDETVAFLERIEGLGLMDAIAEGLFADVKRPRDGGKGLEGLRKKAPGYWNPFETHLRRELKLEA
jgi:beta-lysine 5,6-aminomutase alpha subunit